MTPLEAGPGLQALLAGVLGLILGSFANVCIHRLPEQRSVVWPGSSCPACGAPIRWYDNLPVLSWLWLGGRCRQCRAPVSWQYPLVEASAAALLVALCLQHGLSWRWASLSWLALSVLILVPIDARHGILPDKVTLTGILAGLGFSFSGGGPGWRGALAGIVVGALVPTAIRTLYMVYARIRRGPAVAGGGEGQAPGDFEEERREGMGLGDVKMLAMVGAFLGPSNVLLTMLLGSVLGAVFVVPQVLAGRRDMKTPVPFGPFLGVAALVAMFWGDRIIDWYLGLAVGGLLPPAG